MASDEARKGGGVFGDLVVGYLFLGGAGAGGCLVCALMGLLADTAALAPALASRFRTGGGQRWSRLFVPALMASAACLAVGIVCLAADLGRPDRLLLLMVAPTPSYVSFGAWALVACLALDALLAAVWRGLVSVGPRGLALLNVLAALCALAAAAYTGLLLSSLPAVPLWCTPWLPVLFALSAASCGIALVLAAAYLTGASADFGAVLARLALADALIVVLEAAAAVGVVASVWLAAGAAPADLVGLLAVSPAPAPEAPAIAAPATLGALADAAPPATATDVAALASVSSLVAGPDAWLFWGGFVAAGLVVPLGLDLALYADSRSRARRAAALAWARGAAGAGVLGDGPPSVHSPATRARAGSRRPRRPAPPPFSPSVRALAALAAAGCVLIGGLLLRALVVGAGLQPVIGVIL